MRAILLALAFLMPGLLWAAGDVNIGYVATVTASPEVEPGTLQYLVDGKLNTALDFAVGTTGEGVFSFTFDRPRRVSGARFYQTSDGYYSTSYVIEADVEGKGQFDKTLAQGDKAPLKAWVELKWEPVSVRAIRFRSVAGVSGGRRAHPEMAEFQILGQPEVDDMTKAGEKGIAIPYLTAVRPIERTTSLVIAGRGPALLLPQEKDYAEANAALTQALAGVKAEVVQDIAAADPAHRTVICLGNMLNNPLLERLYWNRYTFADALTPGPGNYLLHVVYDPYPYNGGNNIIVIGCSDAAGAKLGAAAFLSLVKEGKLPYLVQAGPKPLVSDQEAKKIADSKPNPTFEDFTTNTNLYLKTGCEAYAQKAVATLEIMAKLYEPGGERNLPGGSFHQALPWNEETTSCEINCAWDAFEECPLINDELGLAARAELHLRGRRRLPSDHVLWLVGLRLC